MTNAQIITNAAVQNGIFTAEEAKAIMNEGRRLPIHTYREWKRMGYQVKKGEHAVLKVLLWKYSEKKDEEGEDKMYRQTAYLFTAEQVEKVQAATIKTAEEIKAYNAMLKAQRMARR